MSTAHGFDEVYRGTSALGSRAPWDIGRTQPVVDDLITAGALHGDVLDIGCGRGRHAVALAGRGLAVTALDVSEVAVGYGRAGAAEAGLDVEWVVGDGVEVGGLRDRFDSVLDCGFFDACPADRRERYAASLRRACRPGADVWMLELDHAAAGTMRDSFRARGVPAARVDRMPRLEAADFRATFATGWEIVRLESSSMWVLPEPESDPEPVGAWLAHIVRS